MLPYRKIKILIAFFSISLASQGQELYPHNEPASSIPKGVLGVRAFSELYREVGTYRNLYSLRLMYGLLPKLSIMANVTTTNHHSSDFPPNLVSHIHNGNQTIYSTGNFQRGVKYPYRFNGIYLYAKYRFITFDKQNQHLRMALYGECSNIKVAHDEAEPSLLDDTKGYGGGLIITYLKKHFAISLTAGAIIPGAYNGFAPDPSGGAMIPTQIKYGRAIKHNLSIGYLLYPFHYENYKQVNINIYCEFIGKTYEAAKVTQYGFKSVPIQTPLLDAGSYIEAHPSIQAIINSNLRIDASVGFNLINKSYARFYPIYMIGIQRYFYFKKGK